jgi:hypothetical protein
MSQNEDLKKIADGVVNFCGEMRTYLENTKESFDRVLNANYHVNTAPIITKTLEQEYEDILATNGDYEYSSAVGYRAILKNGDTVKATVNSGNSGHFFLNGERMTADYTYTGDGCEMVSVWVFENVSDMLVAPISLNDTPSFTPYEIHIKRISQAPSINENYYLRAIVIDLYNFQLPTAPWGCDVFICNGILTLSATPIGAARVLYSDCETFSAAIDGNKTLEEVHLSKTKKLQGSAFGNNSNLKTFEFGSLEIIEGSTNAAWALPFKNAPYVFIPSTVRTINAIICKDCKDIRLECTKATISSNWVVGKPTSFSMAKDWQASINIAVAASNWNKEKFIDLFENYLFDLSGVGADGTLYTERELTIPKAIYDTLTDDEFAIAENKGWIVGGA